MRHPLIAAALAPWIFALGACTQENPALHIPAGSGNGANGTAAGGPVGTGLPCDVATILQNRCWSCHGGTPTGNAPMSLVTRDQMLAPALTKPSVSNAVLSIARMQDSAAPMPPTGALAPASEVAALQAWIDGGAVAGTCDSVTDPYNTPTVCTSGTNWTRGDRGSANMHPGMACITCHTDSGEGPRFSVAGTVFPTAHEPDDCNGVSGGIQVVITGANGASITLNANSVGNFSSRSSLTLPYTAKVVANGKERAMSAEQTDGDCNSCHTETGSSSAPGRIMAP